MSKSIFRDETIFLAKHRVTKLVFSYKLEEVQNDVLDSEYVLLDIASKEYVPFNSHFPSDAVTHIEQVLNCDIIDMHQ